MRNFMEAYKEARFDAKEKLGVMVAAGLISESEVPESLGRRCDDKGVIPCTDGVNNFAYNTNYVYKAIRIDYDNPSHIICHGIYSCKIDENALDANMIVELMLPDFDIDGDEYHFCATRGDITVEIDFIVLDIRSIKQPSISLKSAIEEIKNDVYIDEKVEQVNFANLF